MGNDNNAHTYQSPNAQLTACAQDTGRPALALDR